MAVEQGDERGLVPRPDEAGEEGRVRLRPGGGGQNPNEGGGDGQRCHSGERSEPFTNTAGCQEKGGHEFGRKMPGRVITADLR